MFSKLAKHAHHEARTERVQDSNYNYQLVTTVKGDSVVNIPATMLQVIVPINVDTLLEATYDSIVTDAVTIFYKPFFQLNQLGVKTLKGMQVKATTPAKVVKPGFVATTYKNVSLHTTDHVWKDSLSTEKQVVKKRDHRLGGYTTIITIISLLCVGWFIAKQFKIKIPFL